MYEMNLKISGVYDFMNGEIKLFNWFKLLFLKCIVVFQINK